MSGEREQVEAASSELLVGRAGRGGREARKQAWSELRVGRRKEEERGGMPQSAEMPCLSYRVRKEWRTSNVGEFKIDVGRDGSGSGCGTKGGTNYGSGSGVALRVGVIILY